MMRYTRVLALAAISALSATSLCSVAVDAETVAGSFRGMFVCEKLKGAADILHVPLDLTVRGDSVQFARPRFNLDGTRVIGSELAFGNIETDGKVHLTSE